MNILLIILAVLFLLALLPTWPYSRAWGYAPSGLGTLLLIIVLLAILL